MVGYLVTRRFLLWLAVLVSALLVMGVGGQAAAATCKNPTAQPPSPGSYGTFGGVATSTGCNVWAVGRYSASGPDKTLIEQWNGTAWTIKTSPNAGGSDAFNYLYGVAATSPTDVWAVGWYEGAASAQTLIEHWNGKAWRLQPSPHLGPSNELRGVAATSANNAWAVGAHTTGSPNPVRKTLIEHWNGSAWKVQRSPNPGRPTRFRWLYSVAATSSKNAWAVGSSGVPQRSLIEYWGGKLWKVQPGPSPRGTVLFGVAATSAKNAWAVGVFAKGPLIEHWGGKAWKVQRSPRPRNSALVSVAALSRTNAWAVGYSFSDGVGRALIEHWDGRAWKVQPSPSPTASALCGVAAASPKDAWAVGPCAYGSRVFALHWDGSAWTG